MRKKLFIWNTSTAFLSRIINIMCAFILPRLILTTYGTEVNGLISSISQFLTIIALTEFGVTAVVQTALYEPLVKKNIDDISRIMVSSTNFFRKIAYILVIYIVILCMLYPYLVNSIFGFWYIVVLILAMSINSLIQYLFGITKSQLIAASQRGYIINITEIIINIFNTIVSCFLIYLNVSIHILKITTALIYLIQPIIYTIYIKRNYKINYNIKLIDEPIKQKWNGMAQHISYYILNATDAIVLTLFSTLQNVSIYFVYKLVLTGINQLFSIFEGVVKPIFGEIWAMKESNQLKQYFSLYEWFINNLVCFIFGCTITLITSFVEIYTNGINDANYIVPTFAIIFTLAYAIQSIRNPYNILILSIGHYKQTQQNDIITAIINIIISIILVYKLGLVGVAIGTLVALSYQTCWQAFYVYSNILKINIKTFIKQISINILILITGYILTRNILLNGVTYLSFIIMGLKVSIVWAGIVSITNIIFFRDNIIKIYRVITRDKNLG